MAGLYQGARQLGNTPTKPAVFGCQITGRKRAPLAERKKMNPTKWLIAAAALMASACGSADSEGFDTTFVPPDAATELRSIESDGFDTLRSEEQEQDEEKIFMPNFYGHQNGFGKCGNPFNGTCMVPDTRSFAISVHLFTCSTQTFKNAILVAANGVSTIANIKGWNTTVIQHPVNATGSSHWIIKCANNGPPHQGGVTSISESVGFLWDCHDSARGELCQYKRATSIINENVITAMAPWATATAIQRSNISVNIAKHELGHMLGFGHPSAVGTTLMNSGGGGTLDTFWTTTKGFTEDEKSQLDCYNETSGHNSHC